MYVSLRLYTFYVDSDRNIARAGMRSVYFILVARNCKFSFLEIQTTYARERFNDCLLPVSLPLANFFINELTSV